MRDLLLIAGAGALGSVLRYLVGGLAHRLLGAGLAFGTLSVNVIGSFCLGFVMQFFLINDAIPPPARLAIAVGFLGAFTTFSTFSYETWRYLEAGAWQLACTNIGLNLILAIAATAGGILTAQSMVKP